MSRIVLPTVMAICIALVAWVVAQQYGELRMASASAQHRWELAGVAPALTIGFIIALEAVSALGFFLVAALIAWRRTNDRMASFVALMLAAFGTALPGTCYAIAVSRPIWDVPGGPLQVLGWLILLPFACLFPDGRFVPAWSRYVLPAWAVWVVVFFADGGAMTQANSIAFALSFLVWVAGLGAGVLAQIYRYRAVSTRVQRQQTKWVVLGFALAIPGLGVAVVPHIGTLMFGRPIVSAPVLLLASLVIFCAAALLIPVTIGIAILRHQLYDVDLVINRALVYGALTTLLAAFYGGSVVLLQLVVQALTGRTSDAVIVVSTLATVALFRPLRLRVRRTIAARFYRRGYDAARTIAAFGETLMQDVELSTLADTLVGVVEETMQPAHVSLWLRPVTDVASIDHAERES